MDNDCLFPLASKFYYSGVTKQFDNGTLKKITACESLKEYMVFKHPVSDQTQICKGSTIVGDHYHFILGLQTDYWNTPISKYFRLHDKQARVEKVRSLPSILQYYHQPPRVLEYQRIKDICEAENMKKYIEKRDKASDEKEKICYKSMIFVRNLLLDHKYKDLQELFKVCFKLDIKEFFQLYTQPNFDRISQKVLSMVKEHYQSMSMQECSDIIRQPDPAKYHDIQTSVKILEKLCANNGFSLVNMVNNVKRMFDKELPKINSIVFHGEPNSGKSYITRSLAELAKFCCEISDSGVLMWQSLVCCRIGPLKCLRRLLKAIEPRCRLKTSDTPGVTMFLLW